MLSPSAQQKQGRFREVRAFDKHFVESTRKKGSVEKNIGVFSPTLKTTFLIFRKGQESSHERSVFHEVEVVNRYQMKKNVSVFHRHVGVDLHLLHKSVFDSLEATQQYWFF